MSKQTLKFKVIAVNKKDFHASKKAIPLNSVNIKNIKKLFLTELNKTMIVINILLDIHMMMVSLDLYVLFYHK